MGLGTPCSTSDMSQCACSIMVSTKGDIRAQRLPKETCRFGTDLKFADLASVKSTKWLNDFVASVNGQLVVNTDRYIFQMAALETMLSRGALVSTVDCLVSSTITCNHCAPAIKHFDLC